MSLASVAGALGLIFALTGIASAAHAQEMHDMPGMQHGGAPSAGVPSGNDSDQMDMANSGMGDMVMMGGQLGGYPMTRDASGTAWQPELTPMAGLDWASGGWTGMVHGSIDLVYDHQGGPRGGDKTFSPSMLMVMAQHAAGPGTLTLRTMLSLDPAMGPSGYPLLLQTGETADGITHLVDRQHPHDLFMELAGVYSTPVGPSSSAFLYVGYPGEPALGPAAFMHRFSGVDDPAAPITHHWLDSTHITYGVVTAGFVHGPWKIEGSVFTGREPDQHRWNFDAPRFDSWSGRLSWNPTPDWALQVSYGSIHSPESLSPGVDQNRITASATYNKSFLHGDWQTTFAWGRNDNRPGDTLDAFLLESAFNWGRQTVFARAETAQKDELFDARSPLEGRVFQVSEVSLGYVYDIPVAQHLALGLGVMGTVNFTPSAIRFAYGDTPAAYMPFVRLKLR